MNYKNYLKTSYWKDIRKGFWKKSHKRCFLCRKKVDLQLHHKRYKDKYGDSILFREGRRDFRLLCKDCHKKIHQYHLENYLINNKIKRRELRDFILELE